MALMEPNSIAIIPCAQEQVRSRDTEFAFRQDSDFYYLSGFVEPEAACEALKQRVEILTSRETIIKDRFKTDGIKYLPYSAISALHWPAKLECLIKF